MNAAVPELRSAVMIVVEASWDDASGRIHAESGRMEDKSSGGACLRLKSPVKVGARIRVQWRFEQFSGVVKYCRSDGGEFVVGMQRDKESERGTQGVSSEPTLGCKSAGDLAALTQKVNDLLVVPESATTRGPQEKIMASAVPTSVSTAAPMESAAGHHRQADAGEERNEPRLPAIDGPALADAEARGERPPVAVPREIAKRLETNEETKTMKRKWLDLAPWNHKQEGPPVRSNGTKEAVGGARLHEGSHSLSIEKSIVDSEGKGDSGFAGELLAMDDVYLAAGVMQPPGRGVRKVIEMLRSEHIRNASRDMKRSAVLMALEAGGITVEQVHQDARSRQIALDAYEVEQKKLAEAQWARKAEENKKIQEDLERVQAHYMARISRNLEAVAQEQSIFRNWQTMKQQELQRMNDAVELCVKSVAHEPVPLRVAPEPAVVLAEKASAVAAGASEGGIKAD